MFSKETYIKRRELLRERVSRGGLILLPGNSEAPRNYPDNGYHFRQDSNFLYFYGLKLPDLVGLLDIDAGEDWLFGDDLSMDDIIWTGPQPTVSELGARCGISHTAPLAVLQEKLTLAIRKGRPVHFLPPYRADNKLKLSRWLGICPEAIADHFDRACHCHRIAARQEVGRGDTRNRGCLRNRISYAHDGHEDVPSRCT